MHLKQYIELLVQPAKIIPKTLKDDILKKKKKFKYSSKYDLVILKHIKFKANKLNKNVKIGEKINK